jgi:hypothetical protein
MRLGRMLSVGEVVEQPATEEPAAAAPGPAGAEHAGAERAGAEYARPDACGEPTDGDHAQVPAATGAGR